MKYNIGKKWIATFDLITKKPAVIMPFVFIAFLESLALELIYFSTRFPISLFANPIIKKFYGEAYLHYPGNLAAFPTIFYHAQIAIYIFFGVFLTAVSVNVFKNIKSGLPLKTNALLKNASKNYLSYMGYAIIVMIFIFLIKRIDQFVFLKAAAFTAKRLPMITVKLYYVMNIFAMFLANIIMQTFLLLTVPIIVIEKKPLWKAILRSVYLGFTRFRGIFVLLLLPFLVYLPVTLLKSFADIIIDKTFPEINLYITALGIITSLFIDCFVIICVSQFLLDEDKQAV